MSELEHNIVSVCIDAGGPIHYTRLAKVVSGESVLVTTMVLFYFIQRLHLSKSYNSYIYIYLVRQ